MMVSSSGKLKHLILISVDSMRYDIIPGVEDKVYLKPFNLDKSISVPTLESLSEKGISFTHCITTAPNTPPAHASLLTGLYPPQHGLRSFYWGELSENVRTLGEVLKDQGYKTFFMTDSRYFFKMLNFNRGFNFYFELNEKGFFKKLEEYKDDFTFVFAHFYDVHAPYLYIFDESYKDTRKIFFQQMLKIAKKFKIRVDEGLLRERFWEVWSTFTDFLARSGLSREVLLPLYIKGVNLFDRVRLRSFLKRLKDLGMLDNFLLIITSDHGDGYNPSSGRFGHGEDLVEEIIRIPVIMVSSEISGGKVVDREISIVDIFPTFLRVAGCQVRKDLFDIAEGEAGSLCYGELGYDDIDTDVHSFAERCAKEGGLIKRRSFVIRRFVRRYPFKAVLCGDYLGDFTLEDISDFEKIAPNFFGRNFSSEEIKRIWEVLKGLDPGKRKNAMEEMRLELGLHHSLYNVKEDPFELCNLLFMGRKYEKIFDELKSIADGMAKKGAESSGEWELDDEGILKQLTELGYA